MTKGSPNLVTGASGFVGAAVVRKLLDAGEAVRVLMRPGSDRRNIAGLDVEVVEGDLRAPETLAPAVKGCRALYHVAADYRIWTRDPAAMFRANVDGSAAIVRAAAEAGAERIVYTSSVAVLGIPPGGVGDEDTPVTYGDMIGPYKQSKYKAEERIRELTAQEGWPVVIVNPSTPIGPRDVKPTPTGRIVVDAANGKMPVYVDTGLNVAHVDDVAAGHLLAFAKGRIGERYVLGGENMGLSDILGVIAELTGGRPPLFRVPTGLIMPIAHISEAWCRLTGAAEPMVAPDSVRMAKKKMFFRWDKAARELGYAPRPARDALADAVAWFRANGYIA
ncbi:MAG: NAD-dependent dehydratase [Rhodospirillaceae bacterium]|nr:NAD-dependent dehydratase [Rhodospirillaceae bacterium]